MSDALHLGGYREPLGLWVRQSRPSREHPALRAESIEFSSRGERVGGRVLLPASGGGPYPLVLLQQGLGGIERDAALEAIGAGWAERGAAVASVDFPLTGARADQKLARWLPEPADPSPGPLPHALAIEVARQAVIDLERALDALDALEFLDSERTAFAGFGDAAAIGAAFCALDPRPRAIALGAAAARAATPELAASHYLGRIAPRPLRIVCPGEPGPGVAALLAAAGEGAEALPVEMDGPERPARAAEPLWEFFASALGL